MRTLPGILCATVALFPVSYAADAAKERGDKLEAAVKADDAKTLKALLTPEDRKEGVSGYQLSSDKEDIRHPFDNLVIDAMNTGKTNAYHVLIDYGVWLNSFSFDRAITDLSYIKDHYPDFATTLGTRCLERAANGGDDTEVDRFLKAGVKPRGQALALAVLMNHPHTVAMLVKAGAPHDGHLPLEEGPLAVDEFARRTMKFAVLDALGLHDKDTPEIANARKEHRADPMVPLGRWSFDKTGLSFDLQEDGSGLMFVKSVGNDAGEPVLWLRKTSTTGASFLAVTPVPGIRKKPSFNEVDLIVTGETLALNAKSGPEPGALTSMDGGQRKTMDDRHAAGKYTGPIGKWKASLPVTASAEDKKAAEQVSLAIDSDGKAILTLISPQGVPTPVPGKIRGAAETLSLFMDNGAPPFGIKVQDSGKTLVVSFGSDTAKQMTFVQVKADK